VVTRSGPGMSQNASDESFLSRETKLLQNNFCQHISSSCFVPAALVSTTPPLSDAAKGEKGAEWEQIATFYPEQGNMCTFHPSRVYFPRQKSFYFTKLASKFANNWVFYCQIKNHCLMLVVYLLMEINIFTFYLCKINFLV
jgi:hypothetical protein